MWRRMNQAGDDSARVHLIPNDEIGKSYLDLRVARTSGILRLGVVGYVNVDGTDVLGIRFDPEATVADLEGELMRMLDADAENAVDRDEGIEILPV